MKSFTRSAIDPFQQDLIAKAKAKKTQISLEKSIAQKIKQLTNLITPDNFDKIFAELREIMFGSARYQGEKNYKAGEDYKANDEILKLVMESIFTKALNTKIYTLFYGDLCKKISHLELNIKNKEIKASTLKFSKFA